MDVVSELQATFQSVIDTLLITIGMIWIVLVVRRVFTINSSSSRYEYDRSRIWKVTVVSMLLSIGFGLGEHWVINYFFGINYWRGLGQGIIEYFLVFIPMTLYFGFRKSEDVDFTVTPKH